jgi:hypothetical protein
MQNLQNLISQLESKIPFYEKTNPSVSNSTVGWQIEHSLKTIYQIVLVVKTPILKNTKESLIKVNCLFQFWVLFQEVKPKLQK